MTPSEFEAELARLLSGAAEARDNAGCVACVSCEGCVDCTFCTRSRGLMRSHYCTDSERCVGCTHVRASNDLFSCNHCESCERCAHSSYLVRCYDCTQSSYCFGCVGLVGRDFHILNQPYGRSDYFALTAQLLAGSRGKPRELKKSLRP